MRIKESITKILQHPIYAELQKIKACSETEFYRRYNYKLYEYRLIYGPNDNYTTNLHYYLINKLIKQLPEIDCKITFDYGIWGLVNAFIKVYVNEYDNTIKKRIHFHFINGSANQLVWNCNFVLSDNFDLNNPWPALKALLKPVLFENGLLAYIQYYENCTKNKVVHHYKNYYAPGKLNFGNLSDAKIYQWIKKHFNVDSYLPIDKTIEYVNTNGKHKSRIKLDRYDHSWIFDFDGDMDEIEQEFYNTLDNNTIYI